MTRSKQNKLTECVYKYNIINKNQHLIALYTNTAHVNNNKIRALFTKQRITEVNHYVM